MTEPLDRIAQYFEEFQRSVADCRLADEFRSERWKNAYGALGRLRDRYLFEKSRLTPGQRAALEKVFEKDTFIEGMMDVRTTSEHVVKRDGPMQLWTSENFRVEVVTSAGAVFAAPFVTVPDTKGYPRRIEHLPSLEKAVQRIKRALDNAMATKEQRR
jgi:hypothetical protein